MYTHMKQKAAAKLRKRENTQLAGGSVPATLMAGKIALTSFMRTEMRYADTNAIIAEVTNMTRRW